MQFRLDEEYGKLLRARFNFITYGGQQTDGLAAEEFATVLRDDGMLALARLQRKFRYLVQRYKAVAVHDVSPTEDNQYQTPKMKTHGLFKEVLVEVGHSSPPP